MRRLIVIENDDIHWEDQKATYKQLEYIRGLMKSPKLQTIYLDQIAQHCDSRLTKLSASKRIDALKKNEEFEVRTLRQYEES